MAKMDIIGYDLFVNCKVFIFLFQNLLPRLKYLLIKDAHSARLPGMQLSIVVLELRKRRT